MKRIIALLLAMMMVVSLVGCGGTSSKKNNSGVNIDELESALKEFDDGAKVAKTEKDGGYTFTYKMDSFYTLTITGEADSDEMLTSIVATCDTINTDYFKSLTASQFVSDMADVNNVPMNELTCDIFLFDFSYIVKLLSPEDASAEVQIEGLGTLLDAIKSAQTIGKWKYSTSTNPTDKTATITAQFMGN